MLYLINIKGDNIMKELEGTYIETTIGELENGKVFDYLDERYVKMYNNEDETCDCLNIATASIEAFDEDTEVYLVKVLDIKEKQTFSIFISQPMTGKSEDEINQLREESLSMVKKYLENDERAKDKNLALVKVTPLDIDDKDNKFKILFALGEAIQNLAFADLVYFAKGWEDSKGCRIEKAIVDEYGLPFVTYDTLMESEYMHLPLLGYHR